MVPSTSAPLRLRRPAPLSSCSRDRFKGVRRRSWGRWVSEIRIPHSREKIWLGSYGTAEQAARAYDIASLLLRGTSCSSYLNFADSTELMTSHNQVAALIARGIASPRTIQATASAAANSAVPKDGAAGSNGDVSSPDNMDCDTFQQSCSSTSVKDCEAAEQRPLCTDQYCTMESMRSAHTNLCKAPSVPDSWWIQDVLALILSPKDRSCSPPFISSCSLQLSPSLARPAAPSPSSTTPPLIHNAHPALPSPSSTTPTLFHDAHPALPSSSSSSKTPTTPDGLLRMLFDDFQYPLEGFVRDGFMAIAPAVTTSKRFVDAETAGDADATQLWSYIR